MNVSFKIKNCVNWTFNAIYKHLLLLTAISLVVGIINVIVLPSLQFVLLPYTVYAIYISLLLKYLVNFCAIFGIAHIALNIKDNKHVSWRDAFLPVGKIASLICIAVLILVVSILLTALPGYMLRLIPEVSINMFRVSVLLSVILGLLLSVFWLWRASFSIVCSIDGEQGIIEPIRKSLKLTQGRFKALLSLQLLAILITLPLTMLNVVTAFILKTSMSEQSYATLLVLFKAIGAIWWIDLIVVFFIWTYAYRQLVHRD